MLGVHPQAVFETCAHLAGHGNTPARQRPDLAVVLTAGLAAEHDVRGEYGLDIEGLKPGHRLRTEPGVRRVRDAAELVGDDVWITVTSRGDFEGAESDPTPDPSYVGVADKKGLWAAETLRRRTGNDPNKSRVFPAVDPS